MSNTHDCDAVLSIDMTALSFFHMYSFSSELVMVGTPTAEVGSGQPGRRAGPVEMHATCPKTTLAALR